MHIWLLSFFLMTGALSFTAGITLPLLVLEKLYFFTETPSLIQIVFGLWQNDDLLLAVLVGAFSLVFPVVKLFVLFLEAMGGYSKTGQGSNAFRHVSMLGRWSMMDVLLVAIVIFAAKTSGFATATSQPGLWFYAYAVFASAISAFLIKRSGTASSDLPVTS
ncbi:MAG: paraquat-inducible protein A [Hyphomicrobiales bacterium]